MNKAFNRNGKLSFKQAYPTHKSINDLLMPIALAGWANYSVSDVEPSSIDYDEYEPLNFTIVGGLF